MVGVALAQCNAIVVRCREVIGGDDHSGLIAPIDQEASDSRD